MTTIPAGEDPRTAELAVNLERVRGRLADACAACGRSPETVTLVAVTKTYPTDDVARLAGLGVTQIGENRDQEAAAKAAELDALGVKVDWHVIGRLQRNKCRSVVRYASAVHSVDSVGLAAALAAATERAERSPLNVLVQVSVDGDPTRGGAVIGSDDHNIGLDRVLAAVAGAPALRLRGVMAVAPLGWRPEVAFDRVAAVADRVVREYPQASWVSSGMSSDLEAAVARGSTHVRVGSGLLGKRPVLR